MNIREATEAMEKGWRVRLENPTSVWHQPFVGYEGMIIESLKDNSFLLDGRKGKTKGSFLYVKPAELIIVRRKRSHGKAK